MFKKVSTSYRKIMSIALPLIIGSFGYNVVAATDTLFIGHLNDTNALAAIGLVAPFYLMITLIGLALSRGGQILIARRLGEKKIDAIGAIARSMLFFELILATFWYVLLKFFGYPILDVFIDDAAVLEASVGYLYYRVDGVFFGYAGLAAIALYSGVGRTKIIIWNTVFLAFVNVLFNYALVFGYWGLPKMGIEGAGMASAIAEFFAFFAFLLYTLWDTNSQKYQLFTRNSIDFSQIRLQLQLSAPIALQSGVGVFIWFVFFSLIEKLGTQALAISSAVRVIYIFFSVSAWGLGSATSTIVSQLIGQGKSKEVLPTLFKISAVSLVITGFPALTLLFFPVQVMQIITDDATLTTAAVSLFKLLFFIEIGIAAYTIYYNGIVGTGAIQVGLWINIIVGGLYLLYVYGVIYWKEDLLWAWSAELFYAFLVTFFSLFYLRSGNWKLVKI